MSPFLIFLFKLYEQIVYKIQFRKVTNIRFCNLNKIFIENLILLNFLNVIFRFQRIFYML